MPDGAHPPPPTAGPSVPRRAYEPRAPLVNQVDADNLDDGIGGMLAEGVHGALSRFRVSPSGGVAWCIVLRVE